MSKELRKEEKRAPSGRGLGDAFEEKMEGGVSLERVWALGRDIKIAHRT